MSYQDLMVQFELGRPVSTDHRAPKHITINITDPQSCIHLLELEIPFESFMESLVYGRHNQLAQAKVRTDLSNVGKRRETDELTILLPKEVLSDADLDLWRHDEKHWPKLAELCEKHWVNETHPGWNVVPYFGSRGDIGYPSVNEVRIKCHLYRYVDA